MAAFSKNNRSGNLCFLMPFLNGKKKKISKNSKCFSVHHNSIAPFSLVLLVTTCSHNLGSSREISRDKLLFYLTLLSRIQTSFSFSFGMWQTLSVACLVPTARVCPLPLRAPLEGHCVVPWPPLLLWLDRDTFSFTPLGVSW